MTKFSLFNYEVNQCNMQIPETGLAPVCACACTCVQVLCCINFCVWVSMFICFFNEDWCVCVFVRHPSFACLHLYKSCLNVFFEIAPLGLGLTCVMDRDPPPSQTDGLVLHFTQCHGQRTSIHTERQVGSPFPIASLSETFLGLRDTGHSFTAHSTVE